jgi:hypothetical protein
VLEFRSCGFGVRVGGARVEVWGYRRDEVGLRCGLRCAGRARK